MNLGLPIPEPPAPRRHLALKLALCIALAGLTLANVGGVMQIPKYEAIFQDMLGSPAKLPTLTQWVLGYGRMFGGAFPFLIVVLPSLFVGAWIAIRRPHAASVTGAVLLVLFLAAHLAIGALALQLPLFKIIQALNTT
jgi:type II secretory pathway component PulF